MARNTSVHFAEKDGDEVLTALIAEQETVINDDLISARVKGTWLMIWGARKYDFKDGQRYRLPRDLYNYLRKNGNIYDTLA